MNFEFKNMRRTAQSAIIHWKGLEDKVCYLHASEWWSGGGIDFDIDSITERRISLDFDDMRALVVVMNAMGYLDMDEIAKDTLDLVATMEKDDE